MVADWRRVLISDVCELIVDCVNKTAPVVEGPTPYKMLRTPNVKNGRVSTENCRYVDKDVFEKWTRRADVRRNDVLLTREAPLGEVGIVKSDENLFLGQRLMQYRAKPDVLDSDYLAYAFLSQDLQHQFHMHEGSGSVVSHIRVGDCSKFELNLPQIGEQKRIASALSTLDQKIELNRQINATLESMAQALFKSWFVDFDPVIDNALAAGNDIPDALQAKAAKRKALGAKRKPLPDGLQQQFPDRFVFTEEMGWVPEGWESTSLKSIVELAYGKSLPAKNRVEGDIPVYGSGGASGTHNEALVQGPSVVVGRKGTVGSLYWVDGPFYPIDTVFYVVPQRQGIPLYWIYQALQQIDIQSMGADSAVPGVNRNTLYSLGIVVPDLIVLERYWTILSGLVNKQQRIIEQNRSLAMLRDSLLPKLLSGELRIPDAEKQLVEAL